MNFLLHGCNKHLHRFRCSGKEEHLNRNTNNNMAKILIFEKK